MKQKLIALGCAACLAFTGTAATLPELQRPTLTVNAADNPFDKQDNMEVPYDGSKWVQPENWYEDPIDPDAYKGSAKLWFDQVTIPADEAGDYTGNDGKNVTVNFNVSGAEGTANHIRFHIYHDTRLKIVRNEYQDEITQGPALFHYSNTLINTTEADGAYDYQAFTKADSLKDGVMFTMNFRLPKDAKPGDLYPIGVQYWTDGKASDMFMNTNQDSAGRLQMTYVFTKGIQNGYIKVQGEQKDPEPGTECTIAFDANGGSGSMEQMTAKAGDEIQLPRNEFKPPSGKYFYRWKIGSEYYMSLDTVTIHNNTTVRAIWNDTNQCGDDLTWSFNKSTGTLSFSGTGAMYDYLNNTSSEPCRAPWGDISAQIKAVSLPEGLTAVGSYAFDTLVNLTEISIPDSVRQIGKAAFANCMALKSVKIPDGVTRIEQNTFYYCQKLEEVTIPDSVTYIGGNAFKATAWLDTLSNKSKLVMYNNMLLGYTGYEDVTIPETVKYIPYGAFSTMGAHRITVTIPKSDITIEDDAFLYSLEFTLCGRKNSTAEKYVKKMAEVHPEWDKLKFEELYEKCGDDLDWAFDEASGTLTITGTGDMYDYKDSASIPWSSYLTKIKAIVLPEGLTGIGSYTFGTTTSLEAVEIPSTVSRIGKGAFGLSAIKKITIPRSVTKIEESAFVLCAYLTDITIMNPDCVLPESGVITNKLISTDVGGQKTYFTGTLHGLLGSTAEAYAAANNIKFETVTCYYIYEANGGSGAPLPAKAIGYGAELLLTENPFTAPENKAFDGWQIGDKIYQPGEKIKVTESFLTIKAVWKQTHYNVSFDANGAGGTMAAVKAAANQEYVLPKCGFTAPAGKIFSGWQAGEKTYKTGDKVKVTADLTLKALWKDSVTVTFAANGGTGEMKSVTCTDFNYTLPECSFTAPKYKNFAGWLIDGELKKSGEKITLTGDLTILAAWDIALLTVKFDANGGTGTTEDFILLSGTSVAFPACPFTAPAGMQFSGWQVGGKTYAAGDTLKAAADLTAKAIWEPVMYTVSFDPNGGSGEMAAKTVAPDTEFTFAKCTLTAPAGSEFIGWQIGDKTYEVGDTLIITEDIVVTALWSEPAETVLVGDANSDGTVDLEDAMLLAHYVAKWDGIELDLAACDLNEDGTVGQADAMILARYAAGWDGYDKYIVDKTL